MISGLFRVKQKGSYSLTKRSTVVEILSVSCQTLSKIIKGRECPKKNKTLLVDTQKQSSTACRDYTAANFAAFSLNTGPISKTIVAITHSDTKT